MIRIRPAEREDAPRLAELNRMLNGVDELSPRFVEGQERVLLAEVDGEVVGFACVQVNRSVCYATPWAELTELFVVDESRRGGVGAALVADAERRAWDEGCRELVLRTRENNQEARSLFARCGYQEARHVVFRKHRPDLQSAAP